MVSQKRGLKGYRKVILSLAGAVLVVFGALWITVIFPSLDKVPADYERTLSFDATFMVANPQTQALDTIPISQTLAQKAVGTEGHVLFIEEVRTVVDSATGQDLSALYGDQTVMAIDSHSLEFATDMDERGRTGYWGPPKLLGEGDTFDLWNPGAGRALTATYVRDDTFRDLGVVVFEISEADIPIGIEPQSGMDLYYATDITLWIEPSSGTVVNQQASTITSIDVMGTKMPIHISNVRYAESTIIDLMNTARSASWLLLWFRTLVPWIAIGFGAALVISPAIIVAVRRASKRSTEEEPTELPRPTSLPLDM